MAALRTALLVLASALVALGCQERDVSEGGGANGPIEAARALLVLHDLHGRQPEERPERSKEKRVDRAALRDLVSDLDDRDEFLTDIYLGFVLGSLARNQTRLFTARDGNRAVIHAGQARIALDHVRDRWKVNLEASVPAEFKKRADAEKKSYEEAKARSARVPR